MYYKSNFELYILFKEVLIVNSCLKNVITINNHKEIRIKCNMIE